MSASLVNEAPTFESSSVLDKAEAENFPVASRLVPQRYRVHLLAVYGYARLVDDVGDLAEGDRDAQLDWIEAELGRTFDGAPTHPIFVTLGETIKALSLGPTPFLDLLAANRQDQNVHRYETYEGLEQYCALSANPIGRLVLSIFRSDEEIARARSDEVCTALQLIEHWQDVKEDFEAGRIYLPLEDLRKFKVAESELEMSQASEAFRRLMAFEVGRARELMERGSPLVSMMHGAGRVAVAGFIGGGLAQLDAIERSSYDVLAKNVKASKTSVASWVARTYLSARKAA